MHNQSGICLLNPVQQVRDLSCWLCLPRLIGELWQFRFRYDRANFLGLLNKSHPSLWAAYMYMLTMLGESYTGVWPPLCQQPALWAGCATMCSGTDTFTVTEHGFCRSSTKSNNLDTLWLNVKGRVVLSVCRRWHSVCCMGWLEMEKVEEACDRPNLVEQQFKFCHSSDIACDSHHIVTSRILWHSLDNLLNFHVASDSAEPSYHPGPSWRSSFESSLVLSLQDHP